MENLSSDPQNLSNAEESKTLEITTKKEVEEISMTGPEELKSYKNQLKTDSTLKNFNKTISKTLLQLLNSNKAQYTVYR